MHHAPIPLVSKRAGKTLQTRTEAEAALKYQAGLALLRELELRDTELNEICWAHKNMEEAVDGSKRLEALNRAGYDTARREPGEDSLGES